MRHYFSRHEHVQSMGRRTEVLVPNALARDSCRDLFFYVKTPKIISLELTDGTVEENVEGSG